MKFSVLAAGAAVLPGAAAWGSFGHISVAYVATKFVKPSTATYFHKVLGNSSTDYLAGVATWADSIRYTKWGSWTGPLHYIDANDDPPNDCSVDLSRDCGDMCVVTAIQNYTMQLLNGSDLTTEARAQAAKFVIHFVGDIHQPLHAENVQKGGNGIKVTFDGSNLNLHHVWDTSIAEALVGGVKGQPYDEAQAFAAKLATAIRSGKYKTAAASSWLDGMSLDDPTGTALKWAQESNAYVCTAVMPQGPSAIAGEELGTGTAYYKKAGPVVEEQIARGGYRLAAWLDLIAAQAASDAEEL